VDSLSFGCSIGWYSYSNLNAIDGNITMTNQTLSLTEFLVLAHFEGDAPEAFKVTASDDDTAENIVIEHMAQESETEVYIDSVTPISSVKNLSSAATTKDRIVVAMKASGLSQSDLHTKADIDLDSIESFVNGVQEPSYSQIAQIALALNVTPAWLAFGGSI
jgi:hypothetical protein